MKRLCIVVAVTLTCSTSAALAAPLLAIDFDRRAGELTLDPTPPTGPNTAPGYGSFTIDAATGSDDTSTRTISGYDVTLTIFDDGLEDGGAAGNQPGRFDDRDRLAPDDTPALAQIYDDFIFAGGTAGPTGGIDILIASNGQLAPNTLYNVSIYVFDMDAGGAVGGTFTANYLDGNAADVVRMMSSYNSEVLPTTDDQYKFTEAFLTDASGNLLIKSRRTSAEGVRLNGLEVNVVPEPGSAMLLTAGAVCLTMRRRRGRA